MDNGGCNSGDSFKVKHVPDAVEVTSVREAEVWDKSVEVGNVVRTLGYTAWG